jgi:cation diffusion facilitator CzcD-associated flavoprotein CzcO
MYVIQEIAKTVGHLTVFQRTPNWCAPLHNGKITKEEMRDIRARYSEILALCGTTPGCYIHNPDPRKTLEVTPEEREAFSGRSSTPRRVSASGRAISATC